MGLFGSKTEYKTQLYFDDDNSFIFIRRENEFSCLVEKENKELRRGWKHFFGNQIYFPGYKTISADNVTLGFARDIILDPFNKIPTGAGTNEKPAEKDRPSLTKWIARIAENQRHTYQTKRKSTVKEDFVNWCLIGVLILMVLAWMIAFIVGQYT